MRSVSQPRSSDPHRASLRRRATAFVLALAANVLLIGMLLRLAPDAERAPGPALMPIAFQLMPDRGHAPAPAPARVEPVRGRASPAPVPPPPAPPVPPLHLVHVSKEVFAASDIAALPSHQAASASGGETGSSGDGTGGAAGGAQRGPGGERLYDAQWYVEPSHAQLAYYLPANSPRAGWGLIACRTIADHRVDDCTQLGESPLGSGLARAVRQAAWQFRVLPPRIGGRAMVGAWVRIRIDFSREGAG